MKKSIKKVMANIMAITMLMAALSGCGVKSKTPESNEKKPSTVAVELSGDPGNFQPSTRNVNIFTSARLNFYETLFTWNYDTKIVPLLVDKYEWKDPKHLKFSIHKDITTTAGDTLKASDVIWSLEWASKSNEFARHTKNIDFANTKAVDDYTVEMTIFKPNVFFFNDLSRIDITTKKAFEESPDKMITSPVGTGPYKMVSYTPGVEFVLEKNPNYWQKDKKGEFGQSVDKIVYKFVPEPAQRSIELESGGVDILYDTPTSDLENIKANKNFEVYEKIMSQTPCVYFNSSSDSKCSKKELRQAIAYAIDNVAIAKAAYNGNAHPATSIITPANVEWKDSFDKDTYRYAYNIEKAKKLLAQAGYKPGELKLVMACGGNDDWKAMSEIIQQELAVIGITVKIDIYDPGSYNNILKETKTWDMQINEFSSKGSILFFLNNQVNKATNIRGHWDYEPFQTLLAKTLVDGDAAGIEKLVSMFEEECPIYPLVNKCYYFTYRKGIEGFKIKDDGFVLPGDLTYSQDAKWLNK